MDLSNLNATELKDLLERVKKEIQKREKAEVDNARNEIYAIAHRLGLPLESVIGEDGGKVRRPLGKVAVKYRNPKDVSQEWTGRGRQPQWVKSLLAAGVDLSVARIN